MKRTLPILSASARPINRSTPAHYNVAQDAELPLDIMNGLAVQKTRVVCHDRGGAIGGTSPPTIRIGLSAAVLSPQRRAGDVVRLRRERSR